MISFATPYKKVKAKKNTIRKCKNKAILYSSVVDMNFIDYSIPSWQTRRTFCFILQCIDSYFHAVCAMPRKAANEIVFSLHKLDSITSSFICFCTAWYRACIITLLVYRIHVVLPWAVVEHCSIMETRRMINLNGESLSVLIEY